MFTTALYVNIKIWKQHKRVSFGNWKIIEWNTAAIKKMRYNHMHFFRKK